MKFNVKKFALASGLTWGTFLSLLTILACLFPPYGKDFLQMVMSVYPGYSISPVGIFLALVYGFIDAGTGGLIFSWLYNNLLKKE